MSTNQTATSDHKSLNTTKIPTTYGVVNQGHGSGQAQQCGEVKPVQGYYLPPFSAIFTYRLDRLKPRASRFRGPPTKVYNVFNTVIGLSHLCCHSVLYFLIKPSVIFLTQLHSISEYCRILNTPHHLCLYSKRPDTITKMNDNINSALTGTVNARS